MANDYLSEVLGKVHHPVLCSYFGSPDDARLAVADLMDEGLSEQDFSLLNLSHGSEGALADPMEYVVAPFAGSQSRISDEREGSPDRESEIGAGISTSTPDDDVTAVQEMDDSETAAQDLSYPSQDRSFGDEEAHDVEAAADTGFFQTTAPESLKRRSAEPAIDKIDLPGLGTLIGEGSFGAILLDKVYKQQDRSLAWLEAKLNQRDGESGVSIRKIGAVLAIDINAQSPNPDRVEEVLLSHEACWVRTLQGSTEA